MAELKKYLAKPYHKRRYYNFSQLKLHNKPNDLWVTFFWEVYDLTKLIQQNISAKQTLPVIQAAGTDITHWFDSKTKEPRTHISLKGQEQYYCPQGRFLDLPESPNKEKVDHFSIPWWKNQDYYIGKLTKCSRNIKIINTLANTEDILEVPSQQTINEILTRYQQINFHASSYTWKRNGKNLVMQKTLQQNGIADQRKIYEQLDIPQQEWYIPAIHLYFNDDLSVK